MTKEKKREYMKKSNKNEKYSHTIFIMIWIVRTIFDKGLISKIQNKT